MTKLNKITCWLLLFAMILSACSVLSMGDTHANYKNNVFWNTVVKAGQPISSDCLVPGGQIILLGELTEETEIEINFASRSEITGTLSCELVDPEQSVYLAAFLTNDVIHLTRGTQSVGLHLMPSEEALKLEMPVKVDVFVQIVAGEQVLEGTFRVKLLSEAARNAGDPEHVLHVGGAPGAGEAEGHAPRLQPLQHGGHAGKQQPRAQGAAQLLLPALHPRGEL
jgi:hypothetical protein